MYGKDLTKVRISGRTAREEGVIDVWKKKKPELPSRQRWRFLGGWEKSKKERAQATVKRKTVGGEAARSESGDAGGKISDAMVG